MKFLLILLIIISGMISTCSQCQGMTADTAKTSGKQHAFYIELLGNSFLWSVNYDWIFFDKGILKISGRVGVTYMPHWKRFTEVRGPGIPLELNFLLGKKAHFIELGLGATYFYFYEPYDRINYNFLMENLRLGWRYQKPGSGLLIRIAVLPIGGFPIDWRFDDDGFIIPYYAGISCGYWLLR